MLFLLALSLAVPAHHGETTSTTQYAQPSTTTSVPPSSVSPSSTSPAGSTTTLPSTTSSSSPASTSPPPLLPSISATTVDNPSTTTLGVSPAASSTSAGSVTAHPLPSEELPVTGRSLAVPVAAGIGLLAAGAICVVAARRNLKNDTSKGTK